MQPAVFHGDEQYKQFIPIFKRKKEKEEERRKERKHCKSHIYTPTQNSLMKTKSPKKYPPLLNSKETA